ncbi:response regulator [Siccirubricoccus sp. KC 17139]|uniref:histidine kinase n=1 Tax=Siccirubricoccus soli TaxID=2899147 RepID=A0ABT1DAW1_9PROT|nr:response regulator [Siccirubricoccus soli]MCO6419058.1 response regulator [Siccirubricoccus soli]MCP2685193.1 response regulator [Siccirubricoccus soli]
MFDTGHVEPGHAPRSMPYDVADDVPALIWITDEAGRLVYANRRFEEVFGTMAEVLRAGGWPHLLASEDLPRFDAVFAEARARRGGFRTEVRVQDQFGQRRWHRCEAAPQVGGDGVVLGYVGCSVDVTEAKEAEAALRDLMETLERRIADRTAQLAAEAAARAAAQDRLRHTQKLEALGQLAGGVAHDFNNASAAVLAGLSLLEKRHGAALVTFDGEPRRLLASVREAAERGTAISRRLLAFARREEMHAGDLDPGGLLLNLRAVLANALGPGIRVLVDVPPNLPPLRADQAQLETTLINLAVNARDAMPDGGSVTLGAAEEPPGEQPQGTDLPPGDYVRLWVADTGVGMDEATLARAVEPFFTTKPREKGTGLGLSMADGFIAQAGGAMRLDSAPGLGTTVTFWLPRANAAEEPALPLLRGHALIVEDEPLMRRYLAECLRHEGYEVRLAEDAGQALALLEAGEPCDALVTDLVMPGMDGIALIEASRVLRPGLQAVLLTGTGKVAEIAPQAARAGFALLRKPVSPAELAECLARLTGPAPPVADATEGAA